MYCSVCNEKITGRYLTDKYGTKFCSNSCFESKLPKCFTCNKSMNEWIESNRGRKYCSESCYEVELPKCTHCSKPMKEWVETSNGEKYCNQKCYESSQIKCAHCNNIVSNATKDNYGNVFCSKLCLEDYHILKPELDLKPDHNNVINNHKPVVPFKFSTNLISELNNINFTEVTLSFNSLVERLIKGLEFYKNEKQSYYDYFSELKTKVKSLEIPKQYITQKEFQLFEERKNQLLDLVSYSIDFLEDYLLSLYEDYSTVKYDETLEIFSIIVEKITHDEVIEQLQDKLEGIVEKERSWIQDFLMFKRQVQADAIASFKVHHIDESIYQLWIEDWCNKRFKIENEMSYLIEVEWGLSKSIEFLMHIDSIMDQYKSNLDQFYMNTRYHIHQKYALDAMGNVKERIEIELQLNKINIDFQKEIFEECFKVNNIISRKSILNWALRVCEISIKDQIEMKSLQLSSTELIKLIERLDEIQQNTFKQLEKDTRAFEAILIKRDHEFFDLLYEMNKNMIM